MTRAKAKPGRVVLTGAATVRTADRIHALLGKALHGHGEIEIDCAAVDEADLTLVQLLLAARRSGQQAGKAVRLAGPVTGPLRTVLLQAGFLAEGEGPALPDEAFWLSGRGSQ